MAPDGSRDRTGELEISAPTPHEAAADYITARTMYRRDMAFPEPGATFELEVEAVLPCGETGPGRRTLRFVQRITVIG